jgi:hypothetical protein
MGGAPGASDDDLDRSQRLHPVLTERLAELRHSGVVGLPYAHLAGGEPEIMHPPDSRIGVRRDASDDAQSHLLAWLLRARFPSRACQRSLEHTSTVENCH